MQKCTYFDIKFCFFPGRLGTILARGSAVPPQTPLPQRSSSGCLVSSLGSLRLPVKICAPPSVILWRHCFYCFRTWIFDPQSVRVLVQSAKGEVLRISVQKLDRSAMRTCLLHTGQYQQPMLSDRQWRCVSAAMRTWSAALVNDDSRRNWPMDSLPTRTDHSLSDRCRVKWSSCRMRFNPFNAIRHIPVAEFHQLVDSVNVSFNILLTKVEIFSASKVTK